MFVKSWLPPSPSDSEEEVRSDYFFFFSSAKEFLVLSLHSAGNYVSLPLSESHPLCTKDCKIIT